MDIFQFLELEIAQIANQEDAEEGTPVFLYKAILSSEAILEDKAKLRAECRIT
jgi:hypothetical protein